jgi:amino acid adenylation domain-containing protein
MNEITSGDATSPSDGRSLREITRSQPAQQINEETARAAGEWSLPELFEEQAKGRPEAVAAQFEDAALSYKALNSRANRIAHALIWAGIGPEHIVAVALPRSLDLVAVLLGILKAGAAYLPLDPEYPTDRLDFMLRDAAPTRLITTSEIAPRFSAGTPAMNLDHSETAALLARMPDTNPSDGDRIALLTSRHLAYVIYTSGSTGRPKGVMVTHAGIANLAANQIDRFAITAESRILQFAALSFDAAVSELCLALVSGARLILAPASRLLPGETLGELIAQTGATHATLPPSVLAAMAAGSLPDELTLIVAGEACAPRLVQQWSTGRRMINAYGPTEATVCASMSEPLSGAMD